MFRIELDDLSRVPVLALVEEHLREMHDQSPPDQVFAFDADKLRASDVTFWTAWNSGQLVGCAALKEISANEAEIKSMRTTTASRRTGAGRALLQHLIDTARCRGYHTLFLETGSGPAFEAAHHLYRSTGFQSCGPFGSYDDNGFSVFMRMALLPLAD